MIHHSFPAPALADQAKKDLLALGVRCREQNDKRNIFYVATHRGEFRRWELLLRSIMSIDAELPLPSEELSPQMQTPIKSRDSDTVLTMSSDGEATSGGVGSTLMSPSAAAANPASSFALPTTIDERDGYDEQSSSLELRKDRTVYSRTVTITPPKPEPWWSPNKSTPKKKKRGGESGSSSQEHKETNSPNPFEMALSPFKDMIDAISQHGEKKEKENDQAEAEAEAKENGRKRVERVTGKASDVAAEVIFVHGSCASSSQFDRLLSAIWERFYDDADGTTSPPNITKKIRCHLFDAVGCGSSPHDPKDWSAYGAAEQMKDIEEYVNIVSASSTSATPIYFVGHSYGSSQIVRLLPLLPESISTRVKGVVLLSGALANGPSDVPNDDAPCVFCLPTGILKLIQPKMNDAFLDKAYHPTTDEALVAQGRMVCEGNDMAIVKAFYQQWSWATKDDASKVVTKAIVVHGADDKIIIPNAGEHLNDMLPKSEFKSIPNASHQVMEERPGEVASILLSLLENK